MNSLATGISSFNREHQNVGKCTQLLMIIPVIISPILSVILSPFFLKVCRMNRQRDKRTAVYPFIKYFYRMTLITESAIVVLLFAELLNITVFHREFDHFLYMVGTVHVTLKLLAALMLNILTALLAFHRSLIFFFPVVGAKIAPNKNKLKWLIWGLHWIFHSAIFAILVSISRHKGNGFDWNRHLTTVQYCLYGLVLLSILPYFLMILSIRKLTNLSSRTQEKPENYIKCQIAIILVSKIVMLPYLLAISLDKNGSTVFVQHLLCESTMASLIIQSAYLFNNKFNMDTFKSSVSFKSVGESLRRMDSRVAPMVYTVPITNQRLISE